MQRKNLLHGDHHREGSSRVAGIVNLSTMLRRRNLYSESHTTQPASRTGCLAWPYAEADCFQRVTRILTIRPAGAEPEFEFLRGALGTFDQRGVPVQTHFIRGELVAACGVELSGTLSPGTKPPRQGQSFAVRVASAAEVYSGRDGWMSGAVGWAAQVLSSGGGIRGDKIDFTHRFLRACNSIPDSRGLETDCGDALVVVAGVAIGLGDFGAIDCLRRCRIDLALVRRRRNNSGGC